MLKANISEFIFDRGFLKNLKANTNQSKINIQLIHTLSSAVEYNDEYNRGHSLRVATYARKAARQMGFSRNLVETVYIAGLLHDIGKIAVPASILQKPGKLTNEEFIQIKRHVEYGVNILRNTERFKDVIPMIADHHERWDGSGYPVGKKGTEIHHGGRIIAVADAYDAMTSRRVYRSSVDKEDAYRELRNCSESQFDPEIIKCFC
ncbi:HD-GYP domain-containing protein [Desulfosporosinus fructosivorans]